MQVCQLPDQTQCRNKEKQPEESKPAKELPEVASNEEETKSLAQNYEEVVTDMEKK